MAPLARLVLCAVAAEALVAPRGPVSWSWSSSSSSSSKRGPMRLPAVKGGDSFFGERRSMARTAATAALWVGLTSYVALGAPGKDDVAQSLDADLLSRLVADPFDPSVPSLFCVVFNYMGIWPAIYAALLLPGGQDQKPLPVAPFLAGSVALGMFALTPYLALREARPEPVPRPTGPVGRWFESRANAVLLGAGALGLVFYGLTAAPLPEAVTAYADLFHTQLFVHVTSLDFCAFWLLSVSVVAEDMARRPTGPDPKYAPAFAAVPIFGHLAWLLIRPDLEEV